MLSDLGYNSRKYTSPEQCRDIIIVTVFFMINYKIAFLQLALSASSPIFRGYLADIDCRWPVISGSVDDRTDEERGKKVS